MPPRQQHEPPTLQHLHDSINNLALAFSTFRNTQDQRHEQYLTSIETLQSQIPSNSQASPSITN